MAQKSGKRTGKKKGKKPVSATKKKIMPVKKAAVKKKKTVAKKPVIVKKVIVKAKEVKKVKEIKKRVVAPKKKKTTVPAVKLKSVIVPQEFRMNIRCRSCSFVDGYTAGEKVCHNCKNEIYEIDKI